MKKIPEPPSEVTEVAEVKQPRNPFVTSEGAQGIFSKVTFLKSVHSKEKDEACLGFVVKIFTKYLHRGGVPSQQDFQTFRHPWYGNFPDTCCKRIFYDFRGFPSFSLNLCSAPAFIYLINGHACLSLIYLKTHFYVKGHPYIT